MRKPWVVLCGLVTAALLLAMSPAAYAQLSQSTNYRLDEVFFGAGGNLNSCSTSYCSKQSAAEIAAGNTAGTAFQAQGGFNTDRAPYIAFSTAGSPGDLGYLSTAATATTSAQFAIKTYLSYGYVITLASDPPTSNGNPHTLATNSTPTSPTVGVEQFGINLVHNTSPVSFGNDPVQVPDNTFSFGSVATGYDTPNLFKYVKGDTVAQSTQSSGETDFTVSFIYNVDDLTPDGQYTFTGQLVATSTY